MTAAEAEARSLVLHQFLALRRAGLSALDALNRLVEGLSDSAERTACREAALSLSAVTPSESKDDLVRVLADRSDDFAGAQVLAGSYEAASELSAARRSGVLVFQLMFAGPFFVLAAMSLFLGSFMSVWGSGDALPGPTAMLKDVLDVMRVAGVPVGIFIALVLSRWSRVPVYGAKSLEAARALYVAATHADPQQAAAALSLDRADRALLVTLCKRVNVNEVRNVVVEIARSLEREGRRRVEVHRMLSSLMLSFFAVSQVAGIVIAAYLPIFSIAGNVK